MAFGFVSFVGAVASDGRLTDAPARMARRLGRSWSGKVFEAAGAVAGLAFVASSSLRFVGGWAGPAWSAAVLLASALTSGAAALVLLARRMRPEVDDESVNRLGQVNGLANVVELAVLALLTLSLRSPAGLAFVRWPGMLIPLVVVPAGLVAPLIVGESGEPRGLADAAILTLFGGYALCAAVVGIPGSLSFR